MKNILSGSIRDALRSINQTKTRKSFQLLGVESTSEIWEHLQRQPTYEPWMTPDTLGVCDRLNPLTWQIDHIIPIMYPGSGENGAITEQDMAARMHYTNLQPLRALENITKGNKRVGV